MGQSVVCIDNELDGLTCCIFSNCDYFFSLPSRTVVETAATVKMSQLAYSFARLRNNFEFNRFTFFLLLHTYYHTFPLQKDSYVTVLYEFGISCLLRELCQIFSVQMEISEYRNVYFQRVCPQQLDLTCFSCCHRPKDCTGLSGRTSEKGTTQYFTLSFLPFCAKRFFLFLLIYFFYFCLYIFFIFVYIYFLTSIQEYIGCIPQPSLQTPL